VDDAELACQTLRGLGIADSATEQRRWRGFPPPGRVRQDPRAPPSSRAPRARSGGAATERVDRARSPSRIARPAPSGLDAGAGGASPIQPLQGRPRRLPSPARPAALGHAVFVILAEMNAGGLHLTEARILDNPCSDGPWRSAEGP